MDGLDLQCGRALTHGIPEFGSRHRKSLLPVHPELMPGRLPVLCGLRPSAPTGNGKEVNRTVEGRPNSPDASPEASSPCRDSKSVSPSRDRRRCQLCVLFLGNRETSTAAAFAKLHGPSGFQTHLGDALPLRLRQTVDGFESGLRFARHLSRHHGKRGPDYLAAARQNPG
jgi:hypothetical protein